MKKTIKGIGMLLLATTITITACKKDPVVGPAGAKGDKGDTGAAGQAGVNGTNGSPGAQGPQGAQGLQGAQGPQGVQGNANVTTGIVTLTSSNWGYDATKKWSTVTITDNDISQAIVDRGVVSVYEYVGGTNTALPFTNYVTGTLTYSETISFVYGLQQVTLRIQDSDGTAPNTTASRTFRIVKVSPAFRLANPNLNLKDYTSVEKACKDAGVRGF